jgi:hypothetical protein
MARRRRGRFSERSRVRLRRPAGRSAAAADLGSNGMTMPTEVKNISTFAVSI